jgi:hypothetical protein
LCFWISLRQRFKKIHNLLLRLLLVKADYLHVIYRRLDQDAREYVRLPLNRESWPSLDTERNLVPVLLRTQSELLEWLKDQGRIVWQEMGWRVDSIALFHIDKSTLMVDLLEALSAFKRDLEKKLI